MTLYKLTNTMTGLSYIGATTQSLAKRTGEHRAKARDGWTHPLAEAIRAYGWAAFTVTLLGTFGSVAELHAAERAAIASLGTMAPNGYNRASGGVGTPDAKHCQATKDKIAARALGRPGHAAWNKGATVPPEVRAKISRGLQGHQAWNKGRPATDAHRAALRAAHAGKKNPASRAVEINGKPFPTIQAAGDALGLTRMQVRYKLMTGRARYLEEGK